MDTDRSQSFQRTYRTVMNMAVLVSFVLGSWVAIALVDNGLSLYETAIATFGFALIFVPFGWVAAKHHPHGSGGLCD